MQLLICFISLATLVAVTSSAAFGYLEEPVPQNILESLVEASNLNAPSELVRWKKEVYGSAPLPAPPCPKSYLFSCQPSVATVPCAPAPEPYSAPATYSAPAPKPAPAKSSYAGAYSIPVPRYSFPQVAHQGIPQELIAPVYGYNQQYLY